MLDALDLLQGEPGRRTLRGAGNRGSGEDQKITHKMVYEPLALHMDQTQTHTLRTSPFPGPLLGAQHSLMDNVEKEKRATWN